MVIATDFDRRIAQGKRPRATLALDRGVAVHLGGGYHHAFADHGEGFCPLNDVAVALRSLQRAGQVEAGVVIDLDVHHGNGTAAIFRDDPSVFTFSMHQDHNYPFPTSRTCSIALVRLWPTT